MDVRLCEHIDNIQQHAIPCVIDARLCEHIDTVINNT